MKHTFRALKQNFKKHKKTGLKYLFIGFLSLFTAMAVIGLRALYPFQLLLALPILGISLWYFISLILLYSSTLSTTPIYTQVRRIFTRYVWVVFVCAFVGISFYIVSRTLPNDANPYEDMDDTEIAEYVDQSIDISVLYMDRLTITGNDLLESGLLDKQELNADERALLSAKWDAFLLAARESESMTDVHRYFGQISYFKYPDVHTKSFVISYSLYLKKFELFSRIVSSVGGTQPLCTESA